ncbi:MAG TPA: hypothetical protein VMU39_25890 [Solirubrobacteraceae bacterium]|nr:hypothetical protein [Solirubrobacteraceae bacterium]
MRIVLSTENFDAFAGTETYTFTVAKELERLGHEAVIYSPNRGAMAKFARAGGLRVVGASALPRSCDAAICSDAATCHELAARASDAARIFVAHSADFMLQAPPQLRDRADAVVVLNDRVGRAMRARAWHAPIVRLHQPVDLLRYVNLGPPRPSPRVALVLDNNLSRARAQLIADACRASGLEYRRVGVGELVTPLPELAIADADLVIGLGRSALEAMAAGRPTYVYGPVGGDGWVTPARYPAMEADGFAGISARDLVIDAARVSEDLRSWNEHMGEVNRDLASAHHSAREHATELVELARTLEHGRPAEAPLADECAHLVRLEWQAQGRLAGCIAEVERLRTRLAETEDRLADAHAELRTAHAELVHVHDEIRESEERLEALRRTRRYRLAVTAAAPLDRLRRWLGTRP